MPRACSSGACLRTTRRTRRMRKSISSSGRRQFSVEKAYRLSHSTPADRAASMTSITVVSAARCPEVRGRERCCAHRPFPSITQATWRGTGRCGSSPDGRRGCTGTAGTAEFSGCVPTPPAGSLVANRPDGPAPVDAIEAPPSTRGCGLRRGRAPAAEATADGRRVPPLLLASSRVPVPGPRRAVMPAYSPVARQSEGAGAQADTPVAPGPDTSGSPPGPAGQLSGPAPLVSASRFLTGPAVRPKGRALRP